MKRLWRRNKKTKQKQCYRKGRKKDRSRSKEKLEEIEDKKEVSDRR